MKSQQLRIPVINNFAEQTSSQSQNEDKTNLIPLGGFGYIDTIGVIELYQKLLDCLVWGKIMVFISYFHFNNKTTIFSFFSCFQIFVKESVKTQKKKKKLLENENKVTIL